METSTSFSDLSRDVQLDSSLTSLCLIRPENLVSSGPRVLQVLFDKLQSVCHEPFIKELLSFNHSSIEA